MSGYDACDENVFGPARSYLTAFHLERELIIRLCRDLTSASKKLIFALHRSPEFDADTTVSANVRVIAQILGKTRDVCAVSLHLDAYRSTISNATEELCEAFLFMYFLHTNRLVSYTQIFALFNALQNAAEEESLIITSILVNFVEDKLPSSRASDVTYISEGDYFMGIFDLTGEIMRFAIGNLLDAQSHALSTKSLAALDFLQDLHTETSLFLARNPRLSVERGSMSNCDSNRGKVALGKKMQVFRQSLTKVQAIVREKLVQSLEVVE